MPPAEFADCPANLAVIAACNAVGLRLGVAITLVDGRVPPVSKEISPTGTTL